jgi:hypothetical protein
MKSLSQGDPGNRSTSAGWRFFSEKAHMHKPDRAIFRQLRTKAKTEQEQERAIRRPTQNISNHSLAEIW